jgi:hypothetical protein
MPQATLENTVTTLLRMLHIPLVERVMILRAMQNDIYISPFPFQTLLIMLG